MKENEGVLFRLLGPLGRLRHLSRPLEGRNTEEDEDDSRDKLTGFRSEIVSLNAPHHALKNEGETEDDKEERRTEAHHLTEALRHLDGYLNLFRRRSGGLFSRSSGRLSRPEGIFPHAFKRPENLFSLYRVFCRLQSINELLPLAF